MHRYFQTALLVLTLFACRAFAEAPSTPKETLCSWTEHAAGWNIDEMIKIYSVHGDKEVAFARDLAAQAIVQGQLQKGAHDKWGKEAELAVARATNNDTLDDDKAGDEKVDGDHATISFKDEANLPNLHMVREKGEWKIDVATTMLAYGADLPDVIAQVRASTRIFQTALRDFTAGNFKTSDELVSYLKRELDKLDAGQKV